ncbi:unnamed protein product [Prorocentrum cordatum]|uniref:Uncharacterized protein n=1 Tax=Prorocentrum cordatum TaxID=2364126 RepID=A0ABN9V4F0_9DINO|nr:unnamed protein product [Polarella glacialis]
MPMGRFCRHSVPPPARLQLLTASGRLAADYWVEGRGWDLHRIRADSQCLVAPWKAVWAPAPSAPASPEARSRPPKRAPDEVSGPSTPCKHACVEQAPRLIGEPGALAYPVVRGKTGTRRRGSCRSRATAAAAPTAPAASTAAAAEEGGAEVSAAPCVEATETDKVDAKVQNREHAEIDWVSELGQALRGTGGGAADAGAPQKPPPPDAAGAPRVQELARGPAERPAAGGVGGELAQVRERMSRLRGELAVAITPLRTSVERRRSLAGSTGCGSATRRVQQVGSTAAQPRSAGRRDDSPLFWGRTPKRRR